METQLQKTRTAWFLSAEGFDTQDFVAEMRRINAPKVSAAHAHTAQRWPAARARALRAEIVSQQSQTGAH
jgi:hypothetical protein